MLDVFPLILVFLTSSMMFCSFQYASLAFFWVKFILQYFVPFDEIVFFIYFYFFCFFSIFYFLNLNADCSLLVDRNTTDFCMLTLYPATC